MSFPGELEPFLFSTKQKAKEAPFFDLLSHTVCTCSYIVVELVKSMKVTNWSMCNVSPTIISVHSFNFGVLSYG